MGIVQSRAGESDGGVREVFIGGVKGGAPHQSCQPSLGMGSLGGPHARSGSVRGAPRQPMPDAVELERRFTKVLVSEILFLSMRVYIYFVVFLWILMRRIRHVLYELGRRFCLNQIPL